eukprot:3733565-Prymnesium_polylepis.1
MTVAQTEPAAARSAERAALERRDSAGSYSVRPRPSTFSSTVRQQRLDGTNNNAEEQQKEAKQAAGRRRAADASSVGGRRCARVRATRVTRGGHGCGGCG